MNETETINKRSLALDALRGLAIFLMIISGRIPFGPLPGWMYHVQNPPPTHAFNPNIPGISWVDLVFPLFLFAMGAAFPFALSKKIESGISKQKIIFEIFYRGILLAGFAIVIQHIRPNVIGGDPIIASLLAFLCFIFLFMFFMQKRKNFSDKIYFGIKFGGLIGIILFLFFIKYPDDSGFSLYRSDIIILVLSNVAVFGSIIWFFTKDNILLRLGFIIIFLGLRFSSQIEGSWVQTFFNYSPFPWLFKIYYLQYLFIVVPGTIAGDLILKWMKSKENNSSEKWSKNKFQNISFISFFIVLFNLWGLYDRFVAETTIISLLIIIIVYYFYREAQSETENLLIKLFGWGSFWLIAGLAFEASEFGGIQKGKSNVSYYFVTTGMSIFLLISFTVFIDYLKKTKFVNWLIEFGQNPMMAYAGGTNLLNPIVTMLFLDELFKPLIINPWIGVIKAVIYTLILALIINYFTRKKIYWRT